MIEQPDYPGLVTLLPTLRRLVDAGGTVILESHEAERIEALGFQAQSGTWRVPPLPAKLVAGNPLLEPLGDDVDAFWRPSPDGSAEVPEIRVSDRPAAEALDAVGLIPRDATPSGNPSSSTVALVCPDAQQLPALAKDGSLEKECAAILEAVERSGGTIERRSLQKKLWRMKAEQFNQAMASLVEKGLIRFEGKIIAASPGPMHGEGL